MEVFGTPNPDRMAVERWKQTWRDTAGRIEVKNFNASVKLLNESDVDPLFYQFFAEHAETTDDSAERYFVVFYKDEHEVFFKLHQGLA